MRCAKRAQVPASSKLGTIFNTALHPGKLLLRTECSRTIFSDPNRLPRRDELSRKTSPRLLCRRCVSRRESLVSRVEAPSFLALSCDVELLASQIHDNIHIDANISWRVESRGEAVRKLNRCCSMYDGGAVYHDVDLGALSTSAGALLCRILLN